MENQSTLNLEHLSDAKVLSMLKDVLEQEIKLYEEAIAKGYRPEKEEGPYVLCFAVLIEEFGVDGLVKAVETLELSEAREMLGEFLEFSVKVEEAKGSCARVEVFGAEVNKF